MFLNFFLLLPVYCKKFSNLAFLKVFDNSKNILVTVIFKETRRVFIIIFLFRKVARKLKSYLRKDRKYCLIYFDFKKNIHLHGDGDPIPLIRILRNMKL
jgi:hypothetical protein